jgi:hypothetical protein
MPSPVMGSLPTSGNLIGPNKSLAASANWGALVDATTSFEAHVDVIDITGATAAATSGLQTTIYHVYASTYQTVGIVAGATSLTVNSGTGIYRGMVLAIGGANPEVVTVANTYTVGSTSVPVSATLYNHSSNDPVYIVAQTAFVGPITLGYNLTAANTTYSAPFFLPTGYYFLAVKNTDATNAVTIESTVRYITSIA